MTDVLEIISYWNKECEQNAFRIRGAGERFQALYRWLDGGKVSVKSIHNTGVWDFIVFDDLFDEQSFLVFYEGTITTDAECPYRSQPKACYRKGVVALENRIVGERYLNNCGHYHIHEAPKSPDDIKKKLMDVLAQEIADQIDREILEEIISLSQEQIQSLNEIRETNI